VKILFLKRWFKSLGRQRRNFQNDNEAVVCLFFQFIQKKMREAYLKSNANYDFNNSTAFGLKVS
jgi:hypothetical protein